MADQAAVNGRDRHKAGTALRANMGDFVHDVITLAELQARLVAVDVGEARARAVRPLILGVVGVVLLLATFPVALFGLAWLLAESGLPLWAALLIVAAGGVIVSGVLGWFAWRTIRSTFQVFQRSGEEFSQNLTWIKSVLRSSRRTEREHAGRSVY